MSFALVIFTSLFVCRFSDAKSKKTAAKAGKSAIPSKLWKIKSSLLLARGAYQIVQGERYALIGHLVEGRATLVDLKTWKIAKTKAWGIGQVHVAIKKKRALVTLSSMKQLLLLEIPSFKVLKSWKLAFQPYGVTFYKKRAVIANYLGDSLMEFDLRAGKIVRNQRFLSPIRVRWGAKQGFVISMHGSLFVIDKDSWKVQKNMKFGEVVGDVYLSQDQLFIMYGDSSKGAGAFLFYKLPNITLLGKRPLGSRPRGLALSKDHIFSFSLYGMLQVYERKSLKLLQSSKISEHGQGLSYGKYGLIALSHTDNKLFKVSR